MTAVVQVAVAHGIGFSFSRLHCMEARLTVREYGLFIGWLTHGGGHRPAHAPPAGDGGRGHAGTGGALPRCLPPSRTTCTAPWMLLS